MYMHMYMQQQGTYVYTMHYGIIILPSCTYKILYCSINRSEDEINTAYGIEKAVDGLLVNNNEST